jgi:demethylmenaquinone methyltransferase/2-methoxy-6-polyprenyl-1,4-benzoquinol methylase
MSTSASTHFGFETVEPQEKTRRVRGVFNSVAGNYDIMNDVMSLGAHRLWKRDYVAGLHLRDGQRVLDLAGGTGDIAFLMRKRAQLDVTVCDINEEMLRVGRERSQKPSFRTSAARRNLDPSSASGLARDDGLSWVTGNAETLPLPSNYFDHCTIAFGIRNVTDIPKALREIHRVLKPGGQFACLEFSEVKSAALKPMYERYSFDLIPQFGGWIAKDKASYQYLVESIRQFPNQLKFKQMIADAGFEQVSHRNVSGGIVAIHRGWKI